MTEEKEETDEARIERLRSLRIGRRGQFDRMVQTGRITADDLKLIDRWEES